MDITVSSTGQSLNWGAKGIDRIVQNIVNLLNTCRYEVAFDRTMGVNTSLLDLPLSEAQARIPYEITQYIEENEPRVEVKDVNVTGVSKDGNLEVEVVITV